MPARLSLAAFLAGSALACLAVAGGAPPVDGSKLPPRPYISGTYVEFDCSQIPPRMILRVGKKRVALLVDSVERMFVYGRPDEDDVEMTCGLQKAAPQIWVEYDPPSASQRGVKGLVRAIHFEALPLPARLKTR